MSTLVGERIVFGQSKGSDVELIVFGDEFYARYETLDGFSVIYDRVKGLYCYAETREGYFFSTGTPIHKEPPVGLPKHLREAPDVRNAKFDQQMQRMRPVHELPTGRMGTLGPNGGLLEGRLVADGAVKGLTILVQFADVQTSITKDQVSAMLNDLDYNANGNYCSVRKYYNLMSSGRLDYTNDVVGPIQLDYRRSHYIRNSLMEEALEKAIDQYDIKLSDYDSLGEGVVDALSFMYAGRTQYSGDLWPHNYVMNFRQGSTRTYYYTIQSLGRSAVDLSIGTFTHESGHMLCRFPDVYDYGKRDGDFEESNGFGTYCMMSAGNHLGRGKVPSPINAYLRNLVGWCGNEVDLNTPGQYTAKHGDYDTVMRYSMDRSNEYFIVENRSKIGLDQYLPDSGLAVMHCDIFGSNEWQGGTANRHYQLALLQADGRNDLENPDGNQGDSSDLFDSVVGRALDYHSSPSTRKWDKTDSGLILSDIAAPGSEINFIAGESAVITGGGKNLLKRIKPDLLIPDDDPNGVSSTLTVGEAGEIEKLTLKVDISHTYRGDLIVELASPDGENVVIFEKTGGSLDNLHLNIDSSVDKLAPFKGKAMTGDWVLTVKDTWQSDVGRLDEWSLDIEYQSTMSELELSEQSNLAIPDANLTGVSSLLSVAQSGQLLGIAIQVDIEHTYRGDMQIELIAPSGQSVELKSRDNDSGANIKTTYSIENVSNLALLEGASIQGDWTLKVRDLMNADTGTLKHWGMKLSYQE